ncbi:hypothetical protein QTH91_21975 [Variovorax dokdonensis]|uniref:Uncharacterized protein n=1 Tax=Variovorax dokdonensis TaxID=344883 RepID=A0ABT7NGU6_9BURK|nr:hypothetical protein [Variovorax dokdonensis]MDM0047176.1 hypothetical protein [Variovorax dokdonensis]
MAAPKPHARLEGWIWVLIYGGLFGVVLGLAIGRVHEVAGWSLGVPGAILVVVGAALIYVRSRLEDSP